MPTLSLNKRAKFDYEILEEFEAGLVLSGQEVKSIRQKQASLKGAYISINKENEVYLKNANVPRYKMAGPSSEYDPGRDRKLLLNKKEINYLGVKLQQQGLTLIPISLYTKNTKIKIKLGLAKGKKKYDKRQDIKNKDEKRKIQSYLKQKIKNTR